MTAVYQIAAVQHILFALKDRIPPEKLIETPLPVLAAPGAWLRGVAEEMGMEADEVPQFIHNCPVVQEDALEWPVLVTDDEKVYRLDDYVPKLGLTSVPVEDKVVHRLRQTMPS